MGDLVQFIEYCGVITMSVVVAYAYHAFRLQTEFDFQSYAAAGIVGATGLTALLRRDGYYEFDRLLSSSGTLRAITGRWALVLMGLIAFGFALKISESFSRVWLGAWTISTLLFILAARFIAARIVRAMIRDGGVFARRIAIVGASDAAERFARFVGAEENGVSVIGVFDAGAAAEKPHADYAGGLDVLEEAARNGAVDDIVITALDESADTMARLIRRLSALPVSVSLCPNKHWMDHRGGAVSQLGGVKVLSLYRRPLEGWGSVMKAVEDYVLGWVLVLVLSPLLLLIAVAIRLQDGGPALFIQKRHGFNNSVFRIYKFRTMTVAEDGDSIKQAAAGDPRVTPLGRVLRRYSLDELH
ncbi:MAG: sugar transferase, partial [Pseudomonadota bacterium]